ncbi:MAG: hypothetical protein C0518_10230 [Opitutus sp.]|nr:hypothetical protein [Opitutus sp.]
MTTSLPSSSPETATGAASASGQTTALLGAFAQSFMLQAEADGVGAPAGADFAALLSAHAPAVPSTTVEIGGATPGPARIANDASVRTCSSPCLAPQAGVASVTASEVSAPMSDVAPADAVVDHGETALPDRATLEAALALVAPLVVAVRVVPLHGESEPGVPLAPDSLPAAVGNVAAQAEHDAKSGLPSAVEPRTVRVALTVPGRATVAVDLPVTHDALPLEEIATALLAKFTPAAADTIPSGTPVPAVAQPMVAANQAEIALPKGGTLALHWSSPSSASSPALVSSDGAALPRVERRSTASLPENSAAPVAVPTPGSAAVKSGPEKNFLSAAKQSVTAGRGAAGIAIAETPSAMPSATPAPIATAHAAAPLAALVERISAPNAEQPVLIHAERSLARRAIDTVTSVVDAQAAARMQPAPVVQLRFKVGSEDLSVRVELRHGEVHTEFRTDSADLRSALSQEWRAVTARPESAVRFLEPVLFAANATGQGSTSFSSHGQSSSQQQQHAQQQFRAQSDFFGSVGRSFAATPAASTSAAVTPLVLPTSQRLSAVA